jgi:flagellar biosynthesis chaperone FliJ
MAFQFPLATVLRVRGIVEEREERLLQGILFEISQTHESLARTEAEIAGSDALRNENVFKKCAGHNLHSAYGEVKELKQSRQALEEQIGKLVLLRDRQIAVYEGARRNREMLTDIRNNQRSIYESDAARREQKTLDDNYIARRGRF